MAVNCRSTGLVRVLEDAAAEKADVVQNPLILFPFVLILRGLLQQVVHSELSFRLPLSELTGRSQPT